MFFNCGGSLATDSLSCYSAVLLKPYSKWMFRGSSFVLFTGAVAVFVSLQA